jgi:uncharacterized protein
MKSAILSASLLLAAPVCAWAQGTPLPGLRSADETRPAEAPSAAPDIPELRKKAAAGDAPAAVQLAGLILAGQVKDAKPADAAALLEKAADTGDAAAQFHFARLLMEGTGMDKPDTERGKFLIQQSAEAGFAPAQTSQGILLEQQVDLKSRNPDFSEALVWYRKAAEQKEPEGLYRLAKFHLSGSGVPKDDAAALNLLRDAAAAGHGLAINEIGISCQKGRGMAADTTAAVGYFVRAAQLGVPAAAVNLGACYEGGLGVERDYARAGASYADAARMGLPVAGLLLGRLYEQGRGTPVDLPKAWAFYDMAAAKGVEQAAAARDALEPRVPADQRAKARAALQTAAPK